MQRYDAWTLHMLPTCKCLHKHNHLSCGTHELIHRVHRSYDNSCHNGERFQPCVVDTQIACHHKLCSIALYFYYLSNPLNLFQFLEHRVKKEKIFTVRLFFHVVSLTFCSYNVKNYVHKTEEPIQKTAFIKT